MSDRFYLSNRVMPPALEHLLIDRGQIFRYVQSAIFGVRAEQPLLEGQAALATARRLVLHF